MLQWQRLLILLHYCMQLHYYYYYFLLLNAGMIKFVLCLLFITLLLYYYYYINKLYYYYDFYFFIIKAPDSLLVFSLPKSKPCLDSVLLKKTCMHRECSYYASTVYCWETPEINILKNKDNPLIKYNSFGIISFIYDNNYCNYL